MANLFGDTIVRPLECTHTNKQYPNAVRCINKWVVQSGLPVDLSVSSSEKSFRKFFGKKVKTLIYYNKAPSFNPGYRCKFVRTAKIDVLIPIKYPLRYIENLHVFDTTSWIMYRGPKKSRGKQFIGGASTYKRLKNLEIESYRQNASLKPLRSLANLQILSLTMQEERFAQNYKIILSLKSLKRLNLSLLSMRIENTLMSPSERPAISDFLIEATKRKKLDFLGMKLAHIFDLVGPGSRTRFLESLSKTDIPAFDIELSDTNLSRIDPEILETCIKNIDLLELDANKNASVSIVCGAGNITEKPRKKLKVISDLKTAASLSSIQAEFEANSFSLNNNFGLESLKALNLASKLERLFRDCFGNPFSLARASNMKHLKSFSFNFSQVPEIIMSEDVTPLLLITLENESHLEHLQLHRDIGHQYFSMISQAPALQNLSSLHFVDSCFIQEHFFPLLSEILTNLKNLKTLRLDLQIIQSLDKNAQSRAFLIIPEKSKLTDLTIKIPVMNDNMISHFIKFILSLNELEVLNLHSGNQLIEADKNRLLLLDGFKSMKKLREVSIFRMIQRTLFAPGVRNNHQHPVVAKVQSELKELFDTNCGLWKFCIESTDPAYQIRYKRY